MMIWGEPYHRSNNIESMLQQWSPLQEDWPRLDHYYDSADTNLKEKWIANCWPQLAFLGEAHLNY
ncbi:MAG: hypothetical protein JKX83_06150 [Pseudomonadales bacterium]|nr:hypothetical protein [Pseudomonadales bacterium]